MSRAPLSQQRLTDLARSLAAGVLFFALVFLAGSALGVAREIVLRAFIGPVAARLIELPVMIAISWFAARFVMRLLGPFARSTAYDIGMLAFVLLQLAEFLFGYWILRIMPLAWLASHFTFVGFLSLFAQASLIALPAFAAPALKDPSHDKQPNSSTP